MIKTNDWNNIKKKLSLKAMPQGFPKLKRPDRPPPANHLRRPKVMKTRQNQPKLQKLKPRMTRQYLTKFHRTI